MGAMDRQNLPIPNHWNTNHRSNSGTDNPLLETNQLNQEGNVNTRTDYLRRQLEKEKQLLSQKDGEERLRARADINLLEFWIQERLSVARTLGENS